MTLFRRKFRIESARKPRFNYATSGHYFFTICTKNRQPVFGSIHRYEMLLSTTGGMVCECWRQIPSHYPDVKLGAFVVMPDHVHGIIIISHHSGMGPTLGNVIGSFKSAATKKIRMNGKPGFGWLPRYHDHVIRDEHERILIERYILENPRRWCDHHR
ncbi:MAG: transposase [Bacteroidales bacterium]|nr:transposase [Bacteroidales bacterium]